jgi:hypothetical protein
MCFLITNLLPKFKEGLRLTELDASPDESPVVDEEYEALVEWWVSILSEYQSPRLTFSQLAKTERGFRIVASIGLRRTPELLDFIHRTQPDVYAEIRTAFRKTWRPKG